MVILEMSRCFPYPPPGYAGKCASNEALILSIKKGKEKALSDRKKEKKREKKEKKRERGKANATALDLEMKKLCTDDAKNLYIGEKFVKRPEEGCNLSKQAASSEYLEKSSVTDEHGKPCCSSDSTENSCKRKRHALTPSHSNQSVGTVTRSLFSSQKREDHSPSPPTVRLCSTSGRANRLSQRSDPNLNRTIQVFSGPAAPVTSSASLPLNPASSAKVQSGSIKELSKHTDSRSHDGKKKLPKTLRKYTKLFKNWTPPIPGHGLADDLDDDQGWFLGGRLEISNPAKRLKSCKEEVIPRCDGSIALQPIALHLSDVDIYALPFTVPF